MRMLVLLIVAFAAASAHAKNATVGWNASLPLGLDWSSPVSASTKFTYIVASTENLVALDVAKGFIDWTYNRPGYNTLYMPLSVVHGALFPRVTYPNTNYSDGAIDVVAVNTGNLVSRTNKPVSENTNSAVLDSDNFLLVAEPPVGNSSIQTVTVFNSSNGKALWGLDESSTLTRQGALAADGVVVVVTAGAPPKPNARAPENYAVSAFDETSSELLWSSRCTLFLADSATRPGSTQFPGGLIAVVNVTNATSLLSFTSTLIVVSRAWGKPVAVVPLSHNQLMVTGAFISGNRIVSTDSMTTLACIDLTTERTLWNASLWADPVFRPFVDIVTTVSEAGDQILVQFTTSPASTNYSAPPQLNVTAFDTKTGKRQGSIAFANSAGLVLMPLLDGRLLVLSYEAVGFQVYSLATGALVADYSWPSLLVGSVQLVGPGIIIGVDPHGTAYQVMP